MHPTTPPTHNCVDSISATATCMMSFYVLNHYIISVKWALVINFRCVCVCVGGRGLPCVCHVPECLFSLASVNVNLMSNKQVSQYFAVLRVSTSHVFSFFYKLPWAAAGSSGLLWCWFKMRVATIDCVCLLAACHSMSLCGAVWTNDNRTVMTTQATFCSFCLTHCLPIYPTD